MQDFGGLRFPSATVVLLGVATEVVRGARDHRRSGDQEKRN
jgi:hypothetical protein